MSVKNRPLVEGTPVITTQPRAGLSESMVKYRHWRTSGAILFYDGGSYEVRLRSGRVQRYFEDEIQVITRDSVPPGVYRHFKGNIYHVLGIAEDTESASLAVVYIPQQDDHRGVLSYRDAGMFLEYVDRPEVPYKGPRFTLIEARNFLG